MNNRIQLIIAGITGFLGVALGAFGAHGLEARLTPDMLDTYNTGVHYHLVHAVVLLALALKGDRNLSLPFIFFIAGILLFSFSLYVYAVTGITFLAMITPVGGVSFLLGWLTLITKGIKRSA